MTISSEVVDEAIDSSVRPISDIVVGEVYLVETSNSISVVGIVTGFVLGVDRTTPLVIERLVFDICLLVSALLVVTFASKSVLSSIVERVVLLNMLVLFIKFSLPTTPVFVGIIVDRSVVNDLSSVVVELSSVLSSSNVVFKVKPTVEELFMPEVSALGVVFSTEVELIGVLVVTISPLFVEAVVLVTSAPVVVFDALKFTDVVSEAVVEDIRFSVLLSSLNVVGTCVVEIASSTSEVV